MEKNYSTRSFPVHNFQQTDFIKKDGLCKPWITKIKICTQSFGEKSYWREHLGGVGIDLGPIQKWIEE
jgi:hypothetical protein